jgi:hypothetical protein
MKVRTLRESVASLRMQLEAAQKRVIEQHGAAAAERSEES